MKWLSDEESVVKPNQYAVDFHASTSIVCFASPAFRCLMNSLSMEGSQQAPSIAGSQQGVMNDSFVVYECMFGSPAAGMLMETLIASGIRQVIMVGDAGSLTGDCKIGDILLPTWGIREEGTSFHYLAANERCEPSKNLVDELRKPLHSIEHHEGGVWTTDAPFRETPAKITRFRKQGAIAVEMECTALMAIASFRDIQFAAVLTITDELFSGKWNVGFKSEQVQLAREIVAKIVSSVVL